MARLILILVGVAIVYWLLKSFSRSATQHKPAATRDAVAEDMVRCAQCGVHLPKSESFLESGNFFCSIAHRDAYRK
jgi:uncharacterized protein